MTRRDLTRIAAITGAWGFCAAVAIFPAVGRLMSHWMWPLDFATGFLWARAFYAPGDRERPPSAVERTMAAYGRELKRGTRRRWWRKP